MDCSNVLCALVFLGDSNDIFCRSHLLSDCQSDCLTMNKSSIKREKAAAGEQQHLALGFLQEQLGSGVLHYWFSPSD